MLVVCDPWGTFKLTDRQKGLVVTALNPARSGYLAGIRKGDVLTAWRQNNITIDLKQPADLLTVEIKHLPSEQPLFILGRFADGSAEKEVQKFSLGLTCHPAWFNELQKATARPSCIRAGQADFSITMEMGPSVIERKNSVFCLLQEKC